MNKFKQEWFIDFAPPRMSQTIIQRQSKTVDDDSDRRWNPDSEPLTDSPGKITVKV
jgi:hypothetical protein